MRITRLRLRQFGPFEDATFEMPEPPAGELGELVLLEGPNGAGKTSVLDAIAATAALFPPASAENACSHAATDRRRLGSVGAIAVTVEHASQHFDLEFAPAGGANERLRVCEDLPRSSVFAYGAGAGHLPPADESIGQLLINLHYAHLQARIEASEASDAERAAKSAVATARGASIERIGTALSAILGREVRFAFPAGQLVPTILVDGEAVRVELLGEGIQRTLSWVGDLLVHLERFGWEDAVRGPLDQEFWLVLDDADRMLHPVLQARLFPALRRLFPRARIYAATNSPFVVASAGRGVLFPIRPDPTTGRVSGSVEPKPLRPGQSLELVVTDIFGGQAGIVDERTRLDLAAHKRDVREYERSGDVDWARFLARRARLLALNAEVRTVVVLQEAPMRNAIDRAITVRASLTRT